MDSSDLTVLRKIAAIYGGCISYGPTGADGPTGYAGPTGPTGDQGIKGDQGYPYNVTGQGPTGPARNAYDGAVAGTAFLDTTNGVLYIKNTNTSGDWSPGIPFGKGQTGDTGPRGLTGQAGPTGSAGPNGSAGVTGPTGVAGITGPRGTSAAQNYAQTVSNVVTLNPSASIQNIVSVNITTNGFPVQIMVAGDANQLDVGWCRLQLYRGATPIGKVIQAEGTTNQNLPYCFNYIDPVSAGTYTYWLKANSVNGSTFNFGEADGPVMTAVELNGAQGPTGAAGVAGSAGSTGPTGFAGTTGSTGPAGGLIKFTTLLDNVSSSASSVSGPATVANWTASYTSSGGTLIITTSFSAFTTSGVATRTFNLLMDGNVVASSSFLFNNNNVHTTIPCIFNLETVSAGSHTFAIQIPTDTIVDVGDYAHMIVQEVIGANTIGLTGPAGTGYYAGDYVAQGRLASNQTVTNSDTAIQFIDDFDPQGWYNASTYRLTPTIAGYYNITLNALWLNGTSAAQQNVQALKNGNTFLILQSPIQTGTTPITQSGTKIEYMNGTTDYITFSGYSANSGDGTLQQGNSDGSGTSFAAFMIQAGGPTGPPGTMSTTAFTTGVVVTGTITNPNTGTRTIDSTSALTLGDTRRITLRLGYAGSAAGTGDYLFQLPTGISFNTSAGYNPIYTGTLWSPNVGTMAPYIIPANGSVVISANWTGAVFVMPYTSTKYRLIVDNTPQQGGFTTMNSGYYAMSASGLVSIEFNIWV